MGSKKAHRERQFPVRNFKTVFTFYDYPDTGRAAKKLSRVREGRVRE